MFHFTPAKWTVPLTLRELVSLIESQVLAEGDVEHRRRTLRHFIRVTSESCSGLDHRELDDGQVALLLVARATDVRVRANSPW